jgi:RHS repeat-associated protein
MYYVASDHLGSPRVVTDAAGTVVRAIQYDSYGQVLLDSNPTHDLPVGFAGGIPDNTGLTRFGYRDYEPTTGRWASRDPILYRSGQANLYQYNDNNPVNLSDREGLSGTIAIPGILPIFIPPGSVFEPGSSANNQFVGSVEHLLELFDPRPLADFVNDVIGNVCKDDEQERCSKAREKCIEICSESSLPSGDFGFRFWNCVNTCLKSYGCL